MDFKSLWEAWKEKKRQEEAAKKSLSAEESMIDRVYESLFGAKNNRQSSGQYKNNMYQLSNQLQSETRAAYNPMEVMNSKYNSAIARGRVEAQPQTSLMPKYTFNYAQYHQGYPDYGLTNYQKKNVAQYYRVQRPYFVSGQAKSSMPSQQRSPSNKIAGSRGYSVPSKLKILTPVAPKRPDVKSVARQSYFKSSPQNMGPRYASRTVPSALRAPAVSRTDSIGGMQNELQQLKQIYPNKRPQLFKQAASNIPTGSGHWPTPNSVEEFATNRGVVRIQSVIRPIGRKVSSAISQSQPSRENTLAQPRYNNPWSIYNRLKSQLSSKRDNFKAADSHAATSTTSNTWEGATAPGQKGAGHNYGYGYGYGTGDALKGGGWGQGFGGGGPGVNENGNHHTPDFNNPNMQWGQGQGWGQGGKGVKQQEQYKPAPPSGASLYPKGVRQSQAPVRHIVQASANTRKQNPLFLPKGPSIMNFEPSLVQLSKKQNTKNYLMLRGNTPVSSPAYQVKYFMNNDARMGYPSDPARSMRNEIISNAVADVLRSIQKKKRTVK